MRNPQVSAGVIGKVIDLGRAINQRYLRVTLFVVKVYALGSVYLLNLTPLNAGGKISIKNMETGQ